jgi:hypothetical protein
MKPESTISSKNILSTEQYRIDFITAGSGSNRLAFTFSEAGNRQLDGPGFGGKFLIDSGFDVVAIKSASDTWYCDFGVSYTDKILEYLSSTGGNYSWHCGYGSSMGGYAAIRFSRVFNLNSVLAISPQFDIMQDWDRRWSTQAKAFRDMRPVDASDLDETCSYFIVYDPYDLDRLHFEQYEKVISPKQMTPVRVQNSGHPSGQVLRDTGLLQSIAFSVLTSATIDETWKKTFHSKRIYSDRWYFNLAQRCVSRRKLKWAEHAARQALMLKPLNAEYNIRLAGIYDRLGNIDKTVTHAAAAVACNPWHPHMAALLAKALAKKKMHKQALFHIDRAIDLSGGDERLIKQKNEMGSP